MKSRIPANKRGTLEQVFVHEDATRKYSPTAALVIGLLSYSIARFGTATHSRTTISRRLRCSRRHAQRLMTRLIEDNWIKAVDAKNASGIGFQFGEEMPEKLKSSYAALVKKKKKSRDDGFLVAVDLSAFNLLPADEINRNKAGYLRKMAYVKALIAYRAASHAVRNNKVARAKYRNLTDLANHLNVCLKTATGYLKQLKEDGDAQYVYDKGLCVDPMGALLNLTSDIHHRLKLAIQMASGAYDPPY